MWHWNRNYSAIGLILFVGALIVLAASAADAQFSFGAHEKLNSYLRLNKRAYANVARKARSVPTATNSININEIVDGRRVRTLCLSQKTLVSFLSAMPAVQKSLLQPVINDYYANFDQELQEYVSILLNQDSTSIGYINTLTANQTINMNALAEFENLFVDNNLTNSHDLCAFQQSLQNFFTDDTKFVVLNLTTTTTTIITSTTPTTTTTTTTTTISTNTASTSSNSSSSSSSKSSSTVSNDGSAAKRAAQDAVADNLNQFKQIKLFYLEYIVINLGMLTDDVFKATLNSMANVNNLNRLLEQESACSKLKSLIEFITSSYDTDCSDVTWNFDVCGYQSKINRLIAPMRDIYTFYKKSSAYLIYQTEFNLLNQFLTSFYQAYWPILNETLLYPTQTTSTSTTSTVSSLNVTGEYLYELYQQLVADVPVSLLQSIQSQLMAANGTNVCSIYANISSTFSELQNATFINQFARYFISFLREKTNKAYETLLSSSSGSNLIVEILNFDDSSTENLAGTKRLVPFCCAFKVIAVNYLNINALASLDCSSSSSITSLSTCDLSKFN